jgi:hypothetical protein
MGVIAMNYTIMRPSPVDLLFTFSLVFCLVVNQKVRTGPIVLLLFLLAWGLSFFVASVPHLYEVVEASIPTKGSVQAQLLIKTFVLTIAFTAAYISSSWSRASYETFMKVYVTACTIASVLGTIGFATGLEALTWDQRARGLLDDPNMYGSMLAPSILCAVYLLHYRVVRPWIMLIVLPVLVVGLMLSFSRAAIVATLIVLAGYVFFLNRLHLRRLLPALVAIVLLALVLFAIASLSSQEFTQKFLQRLTFAESYDLGREGRYGRYLLVLPMILDNPMGLGVLQLEKIFPEPIHNIFLSSFVNYGWAGGITWLVLVITSIVVAVENYLRTRSPVAVLLLFTFLSVVMCASLHEGEHWRHLWLFIGLLWGFTPANFRSAEASAGSAESYAESPVIVEAPALRQPGFSQVPAISRARISTRSLS